MEHYKEYMLGRYRVVEKIEKVDDKYAVRVTAYDDKAATEMAWKPSEIIRFDSPLTVHSQGCAPCVE